MKLSIITLSALLISANAMAKKIMGKVVDQAGAPIEFANVSAFANDSIVGGCVTDSIGSFSVDVPDTCDKIRISFIGHADTILSPSKENLGNIILRRNATALMEVVITAPLIRREADRIVLNVAANPLSANKDAHELLKTAPGVWVTDNTLSIYGQNGTTVYIDDRKVNLSGAQLVTYLKSVQSASVASIEIIPRAGAEYDADSSGGVIRIRLKRNRVDGLSGSAGITTTIGEYKAWISPFTSLSLHSGRWTFNLSGNINGSPSDRYVTHETSENDNIGLSLTGISRHKTKALQGNAMIGVFYEPTDKDRIGIQVDYNSDTNNSSASSRTAMSSESSDDTTLGQYHSQYRFHNLNLTLNLSHILDDMGSVLKWNSNYNYQSSSTDENNRMQRLITSIDSTYTTDNTNLYNIFVSELSIQKNFNPDWRLNVGIKYTHNSVAYDSRHLFMIDSQWINNNRYDYHSRYCENIAAVYATFNARAARWRFKAGARGEYYHTSGVDANRSKIDIFPNANISYDLNGHGNYTAALGYYRNIRRPSFWALNPTVRQVSDYSYSVGNPNLTPSYTDALSLDFVLAGKFTIAAGYSYTDDAIRQMFVTHPEHPERMYLSWDNIGKERSGFLHADGFINITKWWNLYASLTYAITSQKMDTNSRYDTFGYLQSIISTTFLLPHACSLTVNATYWTKMKIGNISVSPLLSISPTLQKRFGKHWSALIGVDNMLQRIGNTRVTTSGYDRLICTKQYIAVKLGITYNFNSGKTFRTQRIENNHDGSRLHRD